VSKVALTGKSYKGIYEIPINTILGEKGKAGVNLKVLIMAKCDGIFNDERKDDWFDTDTEH
jgi:hypothetical protein